MDMLNEILELNERNRNEDERQKDEKCRKLLQEILDQVKESLEGGEVLYRRRASDELEQKMGTQGFLVQIWICNNEKELCRDHNIEIWRFLRIAADAGLLWERYPLALWLFEPEKHEEKT